jgi:hypothetical protein
MAGLWVVLSITWKLEDLQAALNVIISVLSALGIFAFARFCWQTSTIQVARNRTVPVSNLLSITTLADVLDAAQLLKGRLLGSQFRRIFMQCIVVLLLSTSAILSGPIARYSSQRGHRVSEVSVAGRIAVTFDNSILNANVAWNETQMSLDRAGFPNDQLLDWLPDPSVRWKYVPSEWNSTWSAECNYTALTPIELTATGNHTEVNGSISLFQEIPGLYGVFPQRFRVRHAIWYQYGGFYTSSDQWKDTLGFMVSTLYPIAAEASGDEAVTRMSVSIAVFHLHDAPGADLNSIAGGFGAGKIPQSTYARTDCELKRPKKVAQDVYSAYPDTYSPGWVPEAFLTNYNARFVRESISDEPIFIPSPEELFRFYQVYMITKDTQHGLPVTRTMSVQLPTIELSTIFLAVVLLITTIIVATLSRYFLFILRHHTDFKLTPESKLDWLLRSIRESAGTFGSGRSLYSAANGDLRGEFEKATFGSLDSPTSSTAGLKKLWTGIERERSADYEEIKPPSLEYAPQVEPMGIDFSLLGKGHTTEYAVEGNSGGSSFV